MDLVWNLWWDNIMEMRENIKYRYLEKYVT